MSQIIKELKTAGTFHSTARQPIQSVERTSDGRVIVTFGVMDGGSLTLNQQRGQAGQQRRWASKPNS